MSKIILTAETGSDISPELAQRYGIYLVPMHVSMGDQTLDDGAFPPSDVCAYYERTGTLPKTSGCAPEDFSAVFARIREEHPQAEILHLAYSAATTVSFQSGQIAAEGMDHIALLDTKHVSVGQCAIVIEVAKYLQSHPNASLEEALAVAKDWSQRARMCFVPNDLEYLRAGGRISNVAYYLGGRLLHLHPRVEVLDGKLIATKKYRGQMLRVIQSLVQEYSEENHLCRDHLWLLSTTGLPEEYQQTAEETAKECGFASISWLRANCVITTHGGPSAIAIAGFSAKDEQS